MDRRALDPLFDHQGHCGDQTERREQIFARVTCASQSLSSEQVEGGENECPIEVSCERYRHRVERGSIHKLLLVALGSN